MRHHMVRFIRRNIVPLLVMGCVLGLVIYGAATAQFDVLFAPAAAPVFAGHPAMPLPAPPPVPPYSSPLPTPMPTVPVPTPTSAPAPTPEPDFSTPEIKIQMTGDVLLHKGPVHSAKTSKGYDFSPCFNLISPCLDGDLSICNMEGPVDVYGGNRKLSSYPQFNAPFEILPALREAGLNLLLTANNHAFDMGWKGLAATRNNIEKADLDFTGIYETQQQYEAPKMLDVQGLKVGILNYTDAVNGLESLIPDEKRVFALRRFSSYSLQDVPAMTAEIESLREAGADFVIVALHWGAEYRDNPTATQRDIAQALCDGGADVIMGGHSHCVQPVEWHMSPEGRTSLIIYSLGNFFADQSSINIPKTQYGMIVSVRVRLDKAGALVWDGADILPTMTYRYRDGNSSNGISYRLLPLDICAEEDTRLDILVNDSEWDKARRALAHVADIAGSGVAIIGRAE